MELVHDSVDVPDPPVMLLGVSVQDKLVEFGLSPRVTVLENPLTGLTVIVEIPAEPTFTVAVAGLIEISKS
jgi:hypothetical protein